MQALNAHTSGRSFSLLRRAPRPDRGGRFQKGALARDGGAGSVWSPAGGPAVLAQRRASWRIIVVDHGGGDGARPWARAGHWRVAWARVRLGGRRDLARNAFGSLFRRLFRRIPSVTGQRVGPPLFSLSL